jgi:hypothetical protein
MNILLFVITMLMSLALLTYARLESFRTFTGMKVQFSTYMETLERKPINDISEQWYDRTIVNSRISQEKREKMLGSSRLSFYLFLNKEDREKEVEMYKQTRELAKQLMTTLYSQTSPLKEMLLEHSSLLDDILNEVEKLADHLSKKKKITKAPGLANLEIENPILKEAFYYMLNGRPPLESQETLIMNASRPVVDTRVHFSFGGPLINEKEDQAEELDAALESEEAHAQAGYESLLDFITLRNSKKIRVYLASRELLQAIYGDPFIVENIIEARKLLYQQVKNDPSQKDAATKSFHDNFSNCGQAGNYSLILDFSVSRTNPADYD